jgi:hypothetical protein
MVAYVDPHDAGVFLFIHADGTILMTPPEHQFVVY